MAGPGGPFGGAWLGGACRGARQEVQARHEVQEVLPRAPRLAIPKGRQLGTQDVGLGHRLDERDQLLLALEYAGGDDFDEAVRVLAEQLDGPLRQPFVGQLGANRRPVRVTHGPA